MAADGQGEHSIMKTVEHSTSGDIPDSVTDQASWESIRNIVHIMIHHPNRADVKWYQEGTILFSWVRLIGIKWITKGTLSKDERERHLQTLHSEIAAVLLASHGIYMTYTATGKAVPALPSLTYDEQQVSPTLTDIVTAGMVKKNRQDGWCDTPYCLAKDLDRKSAAYLAWQKDVQDYCMESMKIPHPLCLLSLAPQSMFKSEREVLLLLLTQTAIQKPHLAEDLLQVRHRVKADYGTSTLLEGATSIGYGEMISRAARLANVKPLPSGIYYVLRTLPEIVELMKKFSN